MATEVRWRRGTAAQHETFTGALSEITHDTTNNNLRLHDGSTPGGYATVMEDRLGVAGGVATLDGSGNVPADQLGNSPVGVSPVANRAALEVLSTSSKKAAIITDESGRNGLFVFDDSDLSAQVSADTLQGIYVAPNSDITGASGAWVRQYSGLADVRWFGAALDDVADDTLAFNKALAVAKDVLFAEGRAYITDMIQVPNNGNLIGLGVERSVFSLKSDFNLLASGVVTLGTGENMALIDKIGFDCYQPTTGTRADMVQYPWIINHENRPRVRIGHVRFLRAWNGINATGNCGGVFYDIVETGTLNVGLSINGALDTMNIGRFRHWPFGIGAVGDGGVGDVYGDGNTVACIIRQCDGLAGTIQTFGGRVVIGSGASVSADRYIDEIHVDGDRASIEVSGSDTVKFGYVYSTKSNADVGYLLSASDTSKVFIDNFQATFGIRDRPAIYAAGASTISIGYVNLNDNSAGSGFNVLYVEPSARLKIDAGIIKIHGAKTSPVVSGSGSIEIGSGVTFEIASASTPLWNITTAARVDLKTPTIIGNPSIGALDWDGVTSVGSYVLKSGRIDGSTDANGLIAVAHGSKIPPRFANAIIAGPDTALFLKLVSVDFANAIFKVFTLAGAPYASSGIALEWQIST